MNYRALAAFGISIALFSGHARAQDDEDDDTTEPAKKGEPAATDAAPKAPATAAVDASATLKAKAADAHEDVGAVATEPTETSPAPERAPVYGKRGDWFIAPYG